MDRAKKLIELAAASGANAVKFQHFRAPYIVSKKGFNDLGTKIAHQAAWDKSVFQVYEEASLPWEWTSQLAQAAKDNGVAFFTAPYDLEAIDFVDEFVPAFKVGSGDVTWLEAIRKMASKGKPIFLATGASSFEDVKRAVTVVEEAGAPLCLMQCNTNYTGNLENRSFANLRVISTFSSEFPKAILGLSDHTSDNLTVLAAVALGACAIEKHFTDDRSRTGPDHSFSLNSQQWRKMVTEAELFRSILGDGIKKIEENELEASIVQRRALRYSRDVSKGHVLIEDDLIPLRPCPINGWPPYKLDEALGRRLTKDIKSDELLESDQLEE